MSEESLRDYYNRRARVYEEIYQKPERQNDLKQLTQELQNRLKDHDVLEVACGTGYWTQRVAESAKSILGLDQSAQVLEIAKSKGIRNACFVQDDAYVLGKASGLFSAGFAGFWWSHVPKPKLRDFLKAFHSKLKPEAKVIFIDNQFVQGSNHPITRTDTNGNTYQTRKLPDGSSHEVLKNFPTDQEFREALLGSATGIEIKRLTYYWLLEYTRA